MFFFVVTCTDCYRPQICVDDIVDKFKICWGTILQSQQVDYRVWLEMLNSVLFLSGLDNNRYKLAGKTHMNFDLISME